MTKAIVLPYTEEQNEPSAPYSKLLVLPDDEQQRNVVLKSLFSESYEVDVDEVEVRPGGEYGDFDVTDDSEYHLYITIIQERPQ
jgi:hypothetical protein